MRHSYFFFRAEFQPEVYIIRKNSLPKALRDECYAAELTKQVPDQNFKGSSKFLNENILPDIIKKGLKREITFNICNKQPKLKEGKISVKNLSFVEKEKDKEYDSNSSLTNVSRTESTANSANTSSGFGDSPNNFEEEFMEKCKVAIGQEIKPRPKVTLNIDLSEFEKKSKNSTEPKNEKANPCTAENDFDFSHETLSMKDMLKETLSLKEKLLDEGVTTTIRKVKKELERCSGNFNESIVLLDLFDGFIENVRELENYN